MQLAPNTSAPDFAALRALVVIDNVDYDALLLARTRTIYGALYQRLQDMLLLREEGYDITITLRSHSKTLTLTAAEAEACFNSSEIWGVLSNRLDALKNQIVDLVSGQGPTLGVEDSEAALLRQAHALCLPAAPAGPTPALPEAAPALAA